MKESIKTGFSFGLTSGVITTLGLLVGLYSSTESKLAVIGGIITIAIADAFSDALGVHISQETNDKNSDKEVWLATLATFLSKFLFASSFILPFLILNLTSAVIVSIIWGFSLLSFYSYTLAKNQNKKIASVIAEHLVIGILVVILTYFLGINLSKTIL